MCGRPYRVDDGTAPLPRARVANAGSAVVDAWTRRAQAEWASVPAFIALADQLEAVGAPQSLVARAHRSAKDELHDAVLTGGIAALQGGRAIALEDPWTARRPSLCGTLGLIRLAVESWLDSCVGEGGAAALAHQEAGQTTDANIREAQLCIARDEHRHGELAWDVLAWTLETGGALVKDAVMAVRDHLPAGYGETPHDDGLSRYGCADAGVAATVAASHLEMSRGRLDRLAAL